MVEVGWQAPRRSCLRAGYSRAYQSFLVCEERPHNEISETREFKNCNGVLITLVIRLEYLPYSVNAGTSARVVTLRQ